MTVLYNGYVNPLKSAKVTPERIDMGVDYAGTGSYVAIGDAVVTQVNPGGWGKYGNYIAYKLTSGPFAGQSVYYAEGVTPAVHVGQKVKAGDVIANLIPGWSSGTEIGWAGTGQDSTYAAASGGGYSEGALTASGQSFSDFIHGLGAPAGLTEGRKVTGTGPDLKGTYAKNATAGGAVQTAAGVVGDIPGAVVGALGSVFDSAISHAKYAALVLVAVVGAFVLMGRGIKRTTSSEG